MKVTIKINEVDYDFLKLIEQETGGYAEDIISHALTLYSKERM